MKNHWDCYTYKNKNYQIVGGLPVGKICELKKKEEVICTITYWVEDRSDRKSDFLTIKTKDVGYKIKIWERDMTPKEIIRASGEVYYQEKHWTQVEPTKKTYKDFKELFSYRELDLKCPYPPKKIFDWLVKEENIEYTKECWDKMVESVDILFRN
jgi:hypothetical protein